MKETLLTVLRDRNTSLKEYRRAADQLSTILAVEASAAIPKKKVPVDTPIAAAQGESFAKEIVLVPILRSGLVLLYPFMHFYPSAKVGFIGTLRDEETAIAHLYYSKLPKIGNDAAVLLLDPMIATGGSACLAVKLLQEAGVAEEQITLVSFIGAPEGISHFRKECPKAGLIAGHIDEKLNPQKFIYPGLGDFGDRYFGTVE